MEGSRSGQPDEGVRESEAPARATCTCGSGWNRHELFERRGDDILYDVELTMVQAALGATLTIPTLDGEVEVEFEPGTQPGERKVLRGRGVPHLNGHGRGDQEILTTVLIPHDLDEQHRQLLRDLDDTLTAEHYASKPDGVLHKLRNLFNG